MDTLDGIEVERSTADRKTIWRARYRDADVTVHAEFNPEQAAISHRVFVQDGTSAQVALGTEPPPAIYKSAEAARDAGLRRAMAYLDRSPNDTRTSAQF
jgi:hypothetical protein